MKFMLDIRVLPGGSVLSFVIPLDLAGPATLRIMPGAGVGHRISILDEDGGQREWFAAELCSLRFEGP